MNRELRTYQNRIFVILGVIFVWALVITVQLFRLQIAGHDAIKAQTDQQHTTTKDIPSQRGEILDRNGRILASSLMEPYVIADPYLIEDPKATVNALAKALSKGGSWRKARLSRLSNKKRRWEVVERRISPKQAAEIKALKLRGISIQRESLRNYPNDWLGSHILGFINRDQTAIEGLERSYHERMSGEPGKKQVLRDGRGRRNALEGKVIKEPVMGSNIVTTIDANYQLFVEDAIQRGLKRTKAESISVVLMDPTTGEILAMANGPDFNPNKFNKYSGFARRNRGLVDVYEPGSSFKIVTAAAALDSGLVSKDQIFDCPEGPIKAHKKVRIRNHAPYGKLTVPEILWHSSNSGAVQLALAMHEKDPSIFYNYIRNFGFGERTGIDLPAESPGILRDLNEWTPVSPYFLSMGHEISTTPLQVLRGLSVIANEGLLVQPFIVSEVVNKDGTATDVRPTTEPKRVIKASTARYMISALQGVVEQGTAKGAIIPGTRVFGKTGTAQRIQGRSYHRNKYNSSFVGFFPANAPRYGMIVVVHDPKGAKVHGGDVAAPIFSEIGTRIINHESASHPRRRLVVGSHTPNWSNPRRLPETEGVMPDFSGLGVRNLLYQSRQLGLRLEFKGQGRVFSQSPAAGTPIPKDRTCSVTLKEG